jgi:hypothetical protein
MRAAVFLIGPAGVGKTTLARTVTKSLPAKVHWEGYTESSRSIPLGVFAHLVSPSTSRDPIALMASARESLIAQQNTVIAVDDAYLLDPLSATLLHQIAIDRAGHILATVRSCEPVPDAVTALWKDGYLQRFELEPFTKEETIALVESVIGGTLEGLSADVMWESSGGNALSLRHLVEGAIDAGTLTQVHGVWQLRARRSSRPAWPPCWRAASSMLATTSSTHSSRWRCANRSISTRSRNSPVRTVWTPPRCGA